MTFDSGILYVCELENNAEAGNKPKYQLVKKAKHWYGEKTVGYGRMYAAKGVNESVDMLVRIHADHYVRGGMYALLGNGEQYRIDGVSQIMDSGRYSEHTNLRYTELSLSRLGELYDVSG